MSSLEKDRMRPLLKFKESEHYQVDESPHSAYIGISSATTSLNNDQSQI